MSSTPGSRELFKRAKRPIPGGVTYSIRYFEPYPLYVSKARGQKIWDVDGNEYTDYWMGHGAKIMGHCYPPVIEVARKYLELGVHVGLPHELEIRLAEQICRMVPSVEMVRFTNSGTEANMYVVRLARGYTKRKEIVKFEGCWHGGYDALHIAVKPPYERLNLGVTEEAVKDTVILPYNDLEIVDREIRKRRVAAVFVEPVAGAGGMIPATPEFLKTLREACDDTGALLVFDEVITGFRLSPGGAQQIYGVRPDITVFGKIVGGGEFAVGAFGGKAEVMSLLDQDKYPSPHDRVFQGGTFSANILTMAAGYTLLSELEKRPEVYVHINTLGERLRREVSELFEKHRVTGYMTGIGSLVGIHFTPIFPKDIKTAQLMKNEEMHRRYFRHLLENRIIALTQESQHFFISNSHTVEDLENLINVTEEFIKIEKHR
ncbi:MAG: aspartate aminotransferase family protein [Nitrososphaeria archaeon]|nr:aspartate aminotransferase family protein [Nitrososphaeria archaeon]